MPSCRSTAGGFTFLSVLFFVAILGTGLTATAVSWRHAQQRANERELLAIGREFREAISLYYHRTPGSLKEFPRSLEALLRDPRYPYTQRYLRRLYRDPITGATRWGLVTEPGGGIVGVFSLSKESPIGQPKWMEVDPGSGSAKTYSDWKFVYQPPASFSITARQLP